MALARGSARRHLKEYLGNIHASAPEEHAIILAHALLLYGKFSVRYPDLGRVLELDLVQTHPQLDLLITILEDRVRTCQINREFSDAAGATLFIQLLQSYKHPELLPLGLEVWTVLDLARPLAVSYLHQKRHRAMYRNELGEVSQVDSALKHQALHPVRFVSAFQSPLVKMN